MIKDLNLKDFIVRKFTKELELQPEKTVFDLFEWKSVDVILKDWKTGASLYDERNLEFPIQYSQAACDIIGSKYFKRANVPNDRGKEYSMKQVAHRMVDFWRRSLLDEDILNEETSQIFYDEVCFIVLNQMIAPNSPQWFNTGLDLYNTGEESDGHYYFDEKEGKVVLSKDKYSRTQGSACFILSIEDKLLGDKSISRQYETETRLFKHGSGTGTNFSTLRAKGEKLTGGGTSSGVLSFLKGFDTNAGTIKSGGTCLAPYQKVYTEKGAIAVKDLADSNEKFIVLSYDPPAKRYKAKWATAWLAGKKQVVRITTDKGQFDLSYDHPVLLSSKESVKAGSLKVGQSIFNCAIDDSDGYPRIGLKDGKKGKMRLHQMIANDLLGGYTEGKTVIHHKDKTKINNSPSNFEFLTNQDEHAKLHMDDEVEHFTHVFLNNKYDHSGSLNGMHSDSDFWKDEDKVSKYKDKQSKILSESGRAASMQELASHQRMINLGYKLINRGIDISTFDKYVEAREKNIAKVGSINKLTKAIVHHFGSYAGYLKQLSANNHRIQSIETIGDMNVYDVGVECPTLDDKTANSGHNFVIWTGENNYFGSGIVVFNSRRAAKMIELDVDHPEILDFIRWKAKEEQKVRDLGKMNYDIGFNGEAYETVSGQNGNNTIRISNDFMIKVDKLKKSGKDSDHLLKGRKDDSVNKTIKVSELWNEFNRCSWECADPALQFSDIFNQWHTCPNGEDGETWAKHNSINSTNPCGEYAFLDDTSCNLASINLLRFYDNETKLFNVESYLQAILLGQLILEATINKGQFPTEDVARRTHLFRTTGLGIANLAGLLLVLGLPYDSDESRNLASSLMSICTGYSYFTSSLMAKEIGAFAKYEINKSYMLEVIRNHARVSGAREDKYERLTYKPIKLNHSLLNTLGFKYLSDNVKTIWNNTIKLGEEHGYRNSQTTVIAPTGTIAFAMDCEATSTEPFFAHIIYKKLASGGGMSIVNPLIPLALRNLGYSEEDINIINDKITAQQIESCPQLKEEHLPIFDTANKCGSGTRYIQPMGHVKMMAALTPMVSGAISKTVNLPNNATVNDFEQVQLESWRLGVKGIALYRDNCKASQPLNSTDDTNSELKFEDMKYKDLVKIAYDLSSKLERPVRNKPKGILDGHKHCAVIDGLKLQIKLFRYQDTNKICEIYVTADAEGTLAKGLLDSLSKQTSKMLQYNAPITDVIKSLKGQKYEPHGFVTEHPYIKYADSISDLLAKILEIETGDYSSCQIKPEGYVKTDHDIIEVISKSPNQIKKSKEGTKVYGKSCSSCGSSHMRKNGTCFVCEDCGTTTGCS